MSSSIPTISEFKPLPGQMSVIRSIRKELDYSQGVHEVLLSGSVGSAKSLCLAHVMATHCLMYPGAHAGIGRLTMPTLKDTILNVILNHINGVVSFDHNQVRAQITFENGSKMTCLSWADSNYRKFRSYEFSAFGVEELTENETEDFYIEMSMRVGRLNHVPERFIMSATNPDDPSHWAYKRFIQKKLPLRHVFYSKTEDNPFLPKSYIEKLKSEMDPRLVRRMLYGEWFELRRETVYYAYSSEHQFVKRKYTVDPSHPVWMCFDFNIGIGKPLSACFFQYISGVFHFFAEVVINGARTEDAMDEAASRGLFDNDCQIIVTGDATGKHRDTRSRHNDYEIIELFLKNYRRRDGSFLKYKMNVPLSNPKVRDRHNKVNAQHCNAQGQRRVIVYSDCPTLDEGWRLTKLKEGGQYLEDDGPNCPYQHITTAAGYGICKAIDETNKKPLQMIQR